MIKGHALTCAVTRQRVEICNEIADAYQAVRNNPLTPGHHTETAASEIQYLMGAVVEYFDGGDQEVEECDCGAVKNSAQHYFNRHNAVEHFVKALWDGPEDEHGQHVDMLDGDHVFLTFRLDREGGWNFETYHKSGGSIGLHGLGFDK